MTDVSKLILQVDSTSVKTAAASLDDLARVGQTAETSTGRLTKATEVLATAAKAAVAAFGAYKLLSYATEAATLAARFETMGVVMRIAGNNAGYTMAQMEGFSKSLQSSGISMLQSRDALTQLATANIDLANASKLGRAAQDLAVVGNINSSEALGRLIHGIKSGQIETLRTIGLNVSFEAGYKTMAATLGTTSEKLTEKDKVLARTNIALTEAARYNGIYEESMTTAGKAMSSLTRHVEDFKVKAGEAFLPSLATGVFTLTDALKDMNKELDAAGQRGLIADVGDALNGALKTGLQTVAVLAANVAFVFKSVGLEIGAIAAQAVSIAKLDFAGAAAIGEAVRRDGEVGRAALDLFEKKILATGEAVKTVATVSEAERIAAGRASKAAADAAEAAAAAAAKKADAAKKAAKDYEAAIKSARDYIQTLKDETQEVGLSSDQVKMLAAARKAALAPTEALRKAIMQQALALSIATQAEKDATEAQKEATKADIEAFKVMDELRKTSEKQIETASVLLDQIKFETTLLEMNTAQRALATMERDLERQGIVKGTQAYEDYIVKLREAMSLKGVKEAGIEAAADLAEANKKAAEESSKFWEDALMRAFESGKGFFQSLWDTIKNTLKTQVLRVMVQGVMGTLGLSASGSAVASGLGQAGNGLGMISGISSLYSGVSSLVTIGSQVAAGTMGIANALGTVAANATGTGISGLLATNGAYGTAVGGASSAMGSITSALQAIPGWGWALAAVVAIAAFMDDSGTPHTGGFGDYSKAGGERSGAASSLSGRGTSGWDMEGNWNPKISGQAVNLAKGGVGILDTLSTAFGGPGGYKISTGFADDTSKDGSWGALNISNANGKVLDWNDTRQNNWAPKVFSDGEAGTKEYAAAYAKSLKDALMSSVDMPEWAKTAFKGLPDDADLDMITEAARGVATLQAEYKAFGDIMNRLPFPQLKDMSFEAAQGLIAAAGGFDNLMSGLNNFYSNFYTEAEQIATLTDSTAMSFADLGVAMPEVNEGLGAWYRTQVEAAMALDQSIPANAEATAGILALGGSVKTLADGAKSAAASIRDAVAGVSATVDSSLFGMQYGMTDDKGKYDMLDVRANGYNEQMLAATDPLKIADLAQKTMDSMAKAWGVLSQEQQVQLYSQYETRYEAIDTFVATKGADAISLQGARDDATATKLAAAVEVGMEKYNAKLEAAAKQLADAAIALAAASSEPATANVSLTVTKSPGVEVSISEGNFA